MLFTVLFINYLMIFILIIMIPFFFLCIQYAEYLNAAFLPLQSPNLIQNVLTAVVMGFAIIQGAYNSLIVQQFFILSISTFDEIFGLLS